jgi:putative ABC transport system substrate-binding protein
VAESAENVTNRHVIAELVTTYRLPAIFPLRLFAASGGLMSYGVDFVDLLRHAAAQIDKILKEPILRKFRSIKRPNSS